MILGSDGPLNPDPLARVKKIPGGLPRVRQINKRMIRFDSPHRVNPLGIQSPKAS